MSQEKLKPEYVKAIPDKMKLYSQFLGKRPWFAGEKVGGRLWAMGGRHFAQVQS